MESSHPARVPALLAHFPTVVTTTSLLPMSLEDGACNLAAVGVLRRHVVCLDSVVIPDGVFLAMALAEFWDRLAMVVCLLRPL